MEGDILRAKDEINKHAVEIDKMKDVRKILLPQVTLIELSLANIIETR